MFVYPQQVAFLTKMATNWKRKNDQADRSKFKHSTVEKEYRFPF